MEDSVQNLVVYRSDTCFAIINRYPYTSGHLMIVPYQHASDLAPLTPDVRAEMMELANTATQVLQAIYRPQGYNLGLNLGSAAGAGIADGYAGGGDRYRPDIILVLGFWDLFVGVARDAQVVQQQRAGGQFVEAAAAGGGGREGAEVDDEFARGGRDDAGGDKAPRRGPIVCKAVERGP